MPRSSSSCVGQAREAGVGDERRRMAREIHDTLAQGLAGIITQLQAAEGSRPGDGRSGAHIEAALALARDSLAEARRSVQALRPEALERGPAGGRPRRGGRRSLVGTTVAPEVRVTGDVRSLHPELEVALLRVAQEALANVAQHAHASRVAVDTVLSGGPGRRSTWCDDGVGFDPASSHPARPRPTAAATGSPPCGNG